jgi:hypothetical protein
MHDQHRLPCGLQHALQLRGSGAGLPAVLCYSAAAAVTLHGNWSYSIHATLALTLRHYAQTCSQQSKYITQMNSDKILLLSSIALLHALLNVVMSSGNYLRQACLITAADEPLPELSVVNLTTVVNIKVTEQLLHFRLC